MRVSRQYRNLKYRKWFGFGHVNREPEAGELAIFCAACPQPGINTASDWAAEKNQYVRPLGSSALNH